MKKIIIYRDTYSQCEYACKQMGHQPSECIFLVYPLSNQRNTERVKGYYKDVLNDKIKLNGLSKSDFLFVYNG